MYQKTGQDIPHVLRCRIQLPIYLLLFPQVFISKCVSFIQGRLLCISLFSNCYGRMDLKVWIVWVPDVGAYM